VDKAEKVNGDRGLYALKSSCAGVVQRMARELFSVDNLPNRAGSPMNTGFSARELFSVDNVSLSTAKMWTTYPQWYNGDAPGNRVRQLFLPELAVCRDDSATP